MNPAVRALHQIYSVPLEQKLEFTDQKQLNVIVVFLLDYRVVGQSNARIPHRSHTAGREFRHAEKMRSGYNHAALFSDSGQLTVQHLL